MTNYERTLRSNFVHHRLQPLCMAIDNEILAVTYGVGRREVVYIIFDGGYKEIEVTGLDIREMSMIVLDDIDYIGKENESEG